MVKFLLIFFRYKSVANAGQPECREETKSSDIECEPAAYPHKSYWNAATLTAAAPVYTGDLHLQ